MKRSAFVIALLICGIASSEVYAQSGILSRLFRSRQAATQRYSLTYQHGYQTVAPYRYSSSSITAKSPQPFTGYGSNLHRNYMIRRAQKRAAITGIQPRNAGNIYWAR